MVKTCVQCIQVQVVICFVPYWQSALGVGLAEWLFSVLSNNFRDYINWTFLKILNLAIKSLVIFNKKVKLRLIKILMYK